ncbi:MAG: EcsC family protein [Pseudomonadota bacterium]
MEKTSGAMVGPSPYELKALREIRAWKAPKKKALWRRLAAPAFPASHAADLITGLPGVNWVVEKTVGGLITILGDLAHWTVSPERVYKSYRHNGYPVFGPADVFSLDLEDVDRLARGLAKKYQGLAAAEGAVAGSAGLPGLPADIISLTALNQRAAAEYSTHYGFDISLEQERLLALDVLWLASREEEKDQSLAMRQIRNLAFGAARKKALGSLEDKILPEVIAGLAERLGLNLVKSKGLQFIPVVGLAVGAGSNILFTGRVCRAARQLYRERFLLEKYGPDLLADQLPAEED